MKRREFFKKGCAISAGALGYGLLERELLANLGAPKGQGKDPVLVFVVLRGGVDQLSFLPPFEDRLYTSLRPTIALSRGAGTTMKLESPFSLHPSARELWPLWKNKELGFVVRTGLPQAVRSHSDAEAGLELGTPGRHETRDGFLLRALRQLRRGELIEGVALQPTMPRSLMGPGVGSLSLSSLENFSLKLEPGAVSPSEFAELYRGTGDSLLDSTATMVFRSLDRLEPVRKMKEYPAFVRSLPQGLLARRLGDVAWLIRHCPRIPVFVTEMDAWDTHAGQGSERGPFAERVEEFSSGLAAFRKNLGPDWGRTVVVAVTEFGRTAAENCSGATDHGYGSLAMVAGGRVRGGRIFGTWEDLKKENLFEGRDLKVTTDFRHLLSEVLVDHLGLAEVSDVFPGYRYDAPEKLRLLS